MTESEKSPAEGLPAPDQAESNPPPLRSEDLLHGRREVQILHGDEIYRLMVTRNGKLILQK